MSTAPIESECVKPALVFDADTISLVGTFVDELSAYRARREWREVVQNFFMLEAKRDYEMAIAHDELYTLTCTFHSACGRYAFWRLVNNQAPEAEARLHSPHLANTRSGRFLLGSMWPSAEQGPWILHCPEEKSSLRTRIKALLKWCKLR